jgi:hypothetical protein
LCHVHLSHLSSFVDHCVMYIYLISVVYGKCKLVFLFHDLNGG